MPPARKRTPSYLFHKQSGRGRAVWYDATGTRQQKLLPGAFDSPESRTAFARLQLELETSPAATASDPAALTVAELLCAYLDHADGHYRGPDGKPTSKLHEVKLVLRAVRELYAEIPVAEFGPLKLKAVRQKWVDARLVRSECNRRIGMVKRVFKWAVAEELAPPTAYQALAAVAGLERGRTPARESEPVRPIRDEDVAAALPFLNRHVAGLVEFQRLTGCRPGEACAVRRCDLDTTGDVWLYRPATHKTAWKGKSRVIAVGPKAQTLLRQFFVPDFAAPLFSPVRAVAECRAGRAADRKTPRYPSSLKRDTARRAKNPKRPPAERYNRASYSHAIDRACDRAFPPTGELGRLNGESVAKWWARLTGEERDAVKAWRKERRWHPNQLRHSFATKVRKAHGLEAAQVLLGHSRADVTQVYAERNEGLAATVAAKIG